MHVADGVDIWPRTVNRRVDDEARRVHFVLGRLLVNALVVDRDQIPCLDRGKVLGVWVCYQVVSLSVASTRAFGPMV